jgi:hypothetical protein
MRKTAFLREKLASNLLQFGKIVNPANIQASASG